MNDRRRMLKMGLRTEWQRRHASHMPLPVRWRVFKARRKVAATWSEWWIDLRYLVGR